MKVKTVFLAFAATTALLGSVQSSDAQIVSQGGGYLFRLKFAPGSKINIKGNMSTQFGTQKQAINMNVSQTVRSVSGDVATVDYVVTTTGAGIPKMDPQKMTMKMNRRGKIMENSMASQMSGLGGMEFPEGPIKVGHTWTMKQKAGAGMPVTVDARYKFVGVKKLDGMDCAIIAVSTTANGQGISSSGSGTMNIRMADCQLHSMNLTQNMTMSGQGQGSKPMKTAMTMTMKRV